MSLSAFGIERVAETKDYVLYARGSCVAMVHAGSIGSSGYMSEGGLAYLFWREGRAWLVGKGREVEATAEQVDEIQRFSEDLKKAVAAAHERR